MDVIYCVGAKVRFKGNQRYRGLTAGTVLTITEVYKDGSGVTAVLDDKSDWFPLAFEEIEPVAQAQEMSAAAYIKTIEDKIPAEASALDVQVGGDHYKGKGIQPVEYIRANGLCFFRGNVLKYITRTKNGIEDLKKARHYLDMLIEFEEKQA